MPNTEMPAAPRNTEEQLVRPVDRLARHLYDALKSIEAARKVLEEEHSHPYRNTAAVTLREAWHTLDRRLAETADYRPNAAREGRRESEV